MPYRSVEIANEFLNISGAALTQMQLQKLSFIANGWNLAINRQRLIADDPEAWDYGPVYRDLYDHTKYFGGKPIGRQLTPDDDEAARFFAQNRSVRAPYRIAPSEQESAVIRHVWGRYGRLSGPRLSSLTHEQGTPWEQTYYGRGKSAVIPEDMIREHYLELAKRAQAAA